MVRAALAVIALALVGCDEADAPRDAAVDAPDARPDAPPTPAIDWSLWGAPCSRPLWGTYTCVSRDGVTRGYCIMTGEPPTNDVYPGACRHYCFSNPPYVDECPPDGVAVPDGLAASGCHCAQR